MSCMRMVANGRSLDYGTKAILGMADYCYKTLSPAEWPAWQMCNIFTVSWTTTAVISWYGSSCVNRCYFGRVRNGECDCFHGYWGEECNLVCPSGGSNPCYGHGVCSSLTGTCDCSLNWRGTEDCNRCSEGYDGVDCSISVVNNPDGYRITAGIFGHGFVKTLDGARFKINNRGDYFLFSSSEIGIEIHCRITQSSGSVHVSALALKIGNALISISAGVYGDVVVVINKQSINPNTEINIGNTGYVFSRTGHSRFSVMGSGRFSVIVYNRTLSIDIDLSVSHLICKNARGLFGSCIRREVCSSISGPCNATGITSYYNITTLTSGIIDRFVDQWKINVTDILLLPAFNASGEPVNQTVAGTCLYFDHTGIVTPSLGGLLTGKYFSLQFMMKVKNSSNAGTVLSYSLNKTLAVLILNGTMQIHYEGKIYETFVYVTPNIWAEVSLIYHRERGLMQIFFVSQRRTLQTRIVVVETGWFPDGGTLALGLWQASLTQSVSLTLSGFIGWIDEVRIWNARLDAVTIESVWKQDVFSNWPGIVAMWKMNEGEGNIIHDTAGSLHIRMAPSGFEIPRWTLADYDLKAIRSNFLVSVITSDTNDTLRKNAESKCTSLIYSSVFNNTCVNILRSAASYYFQACVVSIISKRSLDASIHAVISYATECKAAGNLTEFPGRELCNHFPGGKFLDWYGINCTKRCIYGSLSGGTCKCDKGYWGLDCSFLCPGGALSPCNDHGTCDAATGQCFCEANWRGDSFCRNCSTGWFGPTCSFAFGLSVNTSNPVCRASETGVYSAFDSLRFSLKQSGKYLMYNSSFVTIYVDHVSCYKKSFCISAIYFEDEGSTVSLTVASADSLNPVLHLNSKIVDASSTEGIAVSNNIAVYSSNADSFQFQVKNTMKITTSRQLLYFSMTISTITHGCVSSKGLCGKCTGTGSMQPSRFAPVGPVIVTRYGLYCLYFKQATLYSKALNIFTKSEVTFDFLVKSCSPLECGGPILSYALYLTIYVSNYITVKVHIGSEIYDTNIATESDKWNQIFISLSRTYMKLDVYIIDSNRAVSYRSFKITSYPIVNGGVLSFGSWIPSTGGTEQQPTRSFNGQIDEIHVWNRYFDFSMVRQNVFVNIDNQASQLVAAWKLNEGQGTFTKDFISGLVLDFPSYPWNEPIWQVSDAPLSEPTISSSEGVPKTKAYQFCFDVLLSGPLNDACLFITNKTKQFYFSECIETVLIQSTTSSSLQIVINYADYCQAHGNLSYWPARSLCNKFPGVRFPKWIGPNCTVLCIHGHKSTTDASKCICDYGYWGLSCNKPCNGGFSKPCSNHGICDIQTGVCLCEAQWKGDKNCSTCTTGWTGTDCSVLEEVTVAKNLSSGISIIGLRGDVILFSKGGFVIPQIGEYYLMYSSHHQLILQGRFVPCYGKFTCLNAFALYVNKNVLVFHAPYVSRLEPVVWLNRTIIDIYQKELSIAKHGFIIKRYSLSKYLVRHSIGSIQITIFERFLSLIIHADVSLCANTSGLLGKCQMNATQILNSKLNFRNCSSRNILEGVPWIQSLDENSIYQRLVHRFVLQSKFNPCDTFFIYSYQDFVEYRDANAIFSLQFNGSAFTIDNSTSLFSSNHSTVEFMIYFIEDGTILSYSYNTAFSLVLINGTVEIWIGNTRHWTGLEIERNVWSQIHLQWSRAGKLLSLYVFDKTGALQRRDMVVEEVSDIFPPGGMLSFGLWQPALNKTYNEPNGTFTGMIDEIKIWSRIFSPAVVWQTWARKVDKDSGQLVSLWELNEGQGTTISDSELRIKVGIPSSPWRSPVWRYSSLILKDQPRYKTIQEKSRNLEQSYRFANFCTEMITKGPLAVHCNIVGPEVAAFYYKSCYDSVVQSENIIFGLQSVVLYSDYCQSSLNLTFWPAQELCNKLSISSLPDWMAEFCDKGCGLGRRSKDNSCTCERGYWGANCSSVCPGGALAPCYGHGTCDQETGMCACAVNWRGSNDCSVCTVGWTGIDCTLATMEAATTPSRRKRRDISTVSAKINSAGKAFALGAHFMSFNGYIVNFYIPGDYWLLRDDVHKTYVEIRQMPCAVHKLCLTAIAINILSSDVVILAPQSRYLKPATYVNRSSVTLSSKCFNVKAGKYNVSIKYTSSNEMLLSRDTSLSILIRFFDKYLSVIVNSDASSCLSTTGILGNCNASAISNIPNATSKAMNAQLNAKWAVNGSENLFHHVNNKISVITGAEYALQFNSTSAVSDALCQTFANNGDYTIELLLRPQTWHGIVFSLYRNTTFALWMSKTFMISVGQATFDTGILVSLDSWHFIALLWKQSSSTLELYVKFPSHTLERRTFILTENPFIKCSLLAVGKWLPSQLAPNPPTKNVSIFIIDELRIWNRYFDPLLIQQNLALNVITSYPNLKALWKLNEGDDERLTNQIITTENIYLSKKPFPAPSWILSNAIVAVNVTNIFDAVLTNSAKLTNIKVYCKNLMYSGPVFDKCRRLRGVIDYFYLLCIKDKSVSANEDTNKFTTLSVMTFLDYCKSVLNLTTSPAQELCQTDKGLNFPQFVGANCSNKCIFGHAVSSNSTDCVCNKGYWGHSCSKVCPGGSDNPCSGHGLCNATSGLCECDEHWKGDEKCSKCTHGWSGSDCELVITVRQPSSTCSLMPSGALISFNNVHTTFLEHGEYYLLNNPLRNSSIHIYQTPCNYQKSICLTKLAVKVNSNHVIIHAPLSDQTQAGVFTNGIKDTLPYKKLSLNNIKVYHNESNLFHINVDGDLNILVRVLGEELSLVVKVSGTYCNSSNSLCSSCYDVDRSQFEWPRSSIASYVKVPKEKLLLSNNENEMTLYQLKFQGIGISSEVLPRVYFARDLTIEIKFTASQSAVNNSTLFTYSKDTTFSIVLQNTIKIIVSNVVYDTEISVNVNFASQITLVYSHALKMVWLYYINYNGIVWYYKIKLPSSFSFMEEYGTLVVGQWLASTQSVYFKPAEGFVGYVHEIRIWKDAYRSADIKNLWEAKTTDTNVNLISFWTFNEGRGDIVYDRVSSVHFYISATSSRAVWIQYTSTVLAFTINNGIKFKSLVKAQEARNWCTQHIAESSLSRPSSCGALGNATIGYAEVFSFLFSCLVSR